MLLPKVEDEKEIEEANQAIQKNKKEDNRDLMSIIKKGSGPIKEPGELGLTK